MIGLGNVDDVYKHYLKVIEENKRLEKKLEIAVKALEEVIKKNEGCMDCVASLPAEKALAKIKEIK